jgi:uncharacterized protein YndB with AHSA1/START domain
MAEPSGDLVLELRRVLPAPPAVVFAALGEPAELARWWGPEGFDVPSLSWEPEVGRSYRIEMQPPEGQAFHLSGEFREVEPPTRLAFTFAWEPSDADDVETIAVLSLRDVDRSTELALTQGSFKTEARRALHRDGWTESLDKLERLLAAPA